MRRSDEHLPSSKAAPRPSGAGAKKPGGPSSAASRGGGGPGKVIDSRSKVHMGAGARKNTPAVSSARKSGAVSNKKEAGNKVGPVYRHIRMCTPLMNASPFPPLSPLSPPSLPSPLGNLFQNCFIHNSSLCSIPQPGPGQGENQPAESHDEKPVKSKFDPSGYDKDLVEALERDIVQTNPNVKWSVPYH